MTDRNRNGTSPVGGGFPGGMFGNLPGPAMMMQMMPYMAGRTIGSRPVEERGKALLEVLGQIIDNASADLPDDQRKRLLDELLEGLGQREPVKASSMEGCC